MGNGARKLLECTLRACGDEEMSRMEEAMAVYSDVFANIAPITQSHMMESKRCLSD